jgi:hypothetical protein
VQCHVVVGEEDVAGIEFELGTFTPFRLWIGCVAREYHWRRLRISCGRSPIGLAGSRRKKAARIRESSRKNPSIKSV